MGSNVADIAVDREALTGPYRQASLRKIENGRVSALG
jgi:hypothetical protein